MRLTQNPAPGVKAYVERIQRRLSRHQQPLAPRNDAFFEAARAVARKHADEELDDLPEHLRDGFGILRPAELLRRIDEAAAMSTASQNGASLLKLLNLWYDVKHFANIVSNHYEQSSAPVFLATAAAWSHDARTFTHSTGVHVIVFYDRIFDFITDLSPALPLAVLPADAGIQDISLFPSAVTALFNESADASPADAQECLCHFVKHHYEQDFTSEFDQRALSDTIRLLAQDVELSMQAFVMGHEPTSSAVTSARRSPGISTTSRRRFNNGTRSMRPITSASSWAAALPLPYRFHWKRMRGPCCSSSLPMSG